MTTERPIPFDGTLTYQHYRDAQRLHCSDRFAVWSVIAFGATLAVIATVLSIQAGEGPWLPLGAIGLTAFFLAMLGVREWSFRKTWKSHKLLRGRMQGALTEDGLVVESDHSSARLPWSQLHQWQASPNLLLIYQARNALNILPRELFGSDKDWAAARELAAAKLPSRRNARRWARARDVFIWFSIFGTLLLLWFAYIS